MERRLALLVWAAVAVGSGLGEMTEPASLAWDETPEAEVRLRAGAALELKCGATGSPPPTIQWLKDGRRVSESELRADEASVGTEVEQVANQGLPTIQMGTTFSKLRAACATAETGGRYSCVASNGVAASLERNVSVAVTAGKTAALCPKARRSPAPAAPALIQMWTDMRLERADAVAQLFCRASGLPRPRISWFHLDEDMQKLGPVQPSDSYILLRNGDLLVRQPQPSDQGGFNFLCEAENPSGLDSQTISLVDVSMDDGDDYEGEDY